MATTQPSQRSLRPQPYIYTYSCLHGEFGVPSHFISTLLRKQLIKPHGDMQLLISCPHCMQTLSTDRKRGNIVAALAVAVYEGSKDTMTILVAFANTWAELRASENEESLDLLQMISNATGKAYQDDHAQYKRLLGVIKDSYGIMVALDIACTVEADKTDPKLPLCLHTIHSRWKAYDRATYNFWDSISNALVSGRYLPIDLTHLVSDILQAGIGYVTEVMGSPQEQHLHFDIAKMWCTRYRSLQEEDLVTLRDIIIETSIIARKLKMRLHQLSWRNLHIVSTVAGLSDISSRIRIINAIANGLKRLDIEKRERWNRWRALTRHLDPVLEATLRTRSERARMEPTTWI